MFCHTVTTAFVLSPRSTKSYLVYSTGIIQGIYWQSILAKYVDASASIKAVTPTGRGGEAVPGADLCDAPRVAIPQTIGSLKASMQLVEPCVDFQWSKTLDICPHYAEDEVWLCLAMQ